MTNSVLYHITSKEAAVAASRTRTYIPATFSAEGFVHCSYTHQVVDAANRLFRGRKDLVLLEIDRTRLACPIVDENLEGGAELFPHVYGALTMDAVLQIHEFRCDESGRFALPEAVRVVRTS